MKIAELFEATPAGMENVNFREVIDRVRKTPEYQEMLKDWIDFSTDKQLANGTIIMTSKDGLRTYGAYSTGVVRLLNASVSSKVSGTGAAETEPDLVKRYLLCFNVMKQKYASTRDNTAILIKDLTNCTSLEQFEFTDNIERLELDNLKIKDLKSLKLPDKVISIYIRNCKQLTDISNLPKHVNKFGIFKCQKLTSLHGIGTKYLTQVDGDYFNIGSGNSINSHILGLFKINFRAGRKQAIYSQHMILLKDEEASVLALKLLQDRNVDVMDAQEALMDAGFEEYAQL